LIGVGPHFWVTQRSHWSAGMLAQVEVAGAGHSLLGWTAVLGSQIIERMAEPREDLRLLSVFHYVVAGFAGLFSLFPLAYVGMGAFFLTEKFQGPNPPPAFIGWFMIAFGVLFMAVGLTYTVLMAFAGRFVGAARNWMYCMFMAGISCAFFPFGTVLGVFTIVVLSKPPMRALFTHQAAGKSTAS
jgi:hypothetical protein